MKPHKHKTSVGIVDDEASIRKALARLLSGAGFLVKTFASGEDLLRIRRAEPDSFHPDCLIVDVHLRGMSGFELQSRLEECGDRTPIIFITAVDFIKTLGDEWSDKLAIQMGGASLLLKPFKQIDLFHEIDNALRSPRKHGTNGHSHPRLEE